MRRRTEFHDYHRGPPERERELDRLERQRDGLARLEGAERARVAQERLERAHHGEALLRATIPKPLPAPVGAAEPPPAQPGTDPRTHSRFIGRGMLPRLFRR